MTEQQIQEQLSKAYTQAIAANAGIIFRDFAAIDYGIDGRFSHVDYDPVHNRFMETGFAIDFQIKATTALIQRGNYLLYDLDVKNYRDLISMNCGTDRILIVYFMPLERSEWVTVSSDCTILKKSAWWCSLRGKPDTPNRRQVRIKIPKNQLLTSDELARLMEKVKGGVAL